MVVMSGTASIVRRRMDTIPTTMRMPVSARTRSRFLRENPISQSDKSFLLRQSPLQGLGLEDEGSLHCNPLPRGQTRDDVRPFIRGPSNLHLTTLESPGSHNHKNLFMSVHV